ncbi:MAG TPA: DUF4383 domain-containing protein [Acidobacteriaceae bacterium]
MRQEQSVPGDTQRKLTGLSKLTAGGLAGCAAAIWIQWLSGDPAYPKVPPGPIIFVLIAAMIMLGTRWWWMPILGALVSLMTTAGWFARFPAEMLRLNHPGTVGRFAAGIFVGTLLQIVTLMVTDVAGVAATVQNYRRLNRGKDVAKAVCQIFGVLFVLIGVVMLFRGAPVDKYHNLLHLAWGAIALCIGFAGSTSAARGFCTGSGGFYLGLGVLGMLYGNPVAKEAWHAGPMLLHTGDHIFHMVLGTALLATGLITSRPRIQHASPAAG